MPIPAVFAGVAAAVAGGATVAGGGVAFYKYFVEEETIYLTGLQGNGKSTFREMLRTEQFPKEKPETTVESQTYKVKGDFCEKIKKVLDRDSGNYGSTHDPADPEAERVPDYSPEEKRIKKSFVILYFFSVKNFIDDVKECNKIKAEIRFYAEKIKKIIDEKPFYEFLDEDKIFIAVGTYEDECDKKSQEMLHAKQEVRDVVVQNISCKKGFVSGSLKNAEEAEKLKKTIIEKIKGLKNGELA
jgi:GTPase SAR1 family protein